MFSPQGKSSAHRHSDPKFHGCCADHGGFLKWAEEIKHGRASTDTHRLRYTLQVPAPWHDSPQRQNWGMEGAVTGEEVMSEPWTNTTRPPLPVPSPPPPQEMPGSSAEMEEVAGSLGIAFKTDLMTLERRLEIQGRLRDQSEENVATELAALRHIAQELEALEEEGEKAALVRRLKEQIDTLERCARYVSNIAETYGAVQYEKRVSHSMYIITKYIEDLRQSLEKEKTLHEETRKLLKEYSPPLPLNKLVNGSKRRASIAALDQRHSPTPEMKLTARKGSLVKRDSDKCLKKEETLVEEVIRRGSKPECVTCMSCMEPADPADCTREDVNDDETQDDFERRDSLFQDDYKSKQKSQMNYKFKKRGRGGSSNWLLEKMKGRGGWSESAAEMATQARYAAAALLLLAALLVLSSSFLMPEQPP